MKKYLSRSLVVIVSLGMLAALAGCAPSTTPSPTASGSQPTSQRAIEYPSDKAALDAVPFSKVCGKKKIVLGFPIGNAAPNFTQLQAMAEQALKNSCPNVSIVGANAAGSTAKAISDINSLVAQGVAGIVTEPVLGPSIIPTYAKAVKSGVPVVLQTESAGAKVGSQITGYVESNYTAVTANFAKFFKREGTTGTIVVVSGFPGDPTGIALTSGLSKYLKVSDPGLKLVTTQLQSSNFDPSTARSVMAGLLAKYGRIDAVVTDYGGLAVSIVDAYTAAGFKPPAIAALATTNGTNCAILASKDKVAFYSTDAFQEQGLIAFRLVLAAINKVKDNEPTLITPFPTVDTSMGIDPKCIPSAPASADWYTTLSDAKMIQISQ
jgi:ribose transport system substrate-binding protein